MVTRELILLTLCGYEVFREEKGKIIFGESVIKSFFFGAKGGSISDILFSEGVRRTWVKGKGFILFAWVFRSSELFFGSARVF